MRLDGLGERLAKTAGLKPQELPSLPAGAAPGRGGAVSSLPSRNLSVKEFSDLVEKLARQVDERSDQMSVLEALLVQDSANRKFLPSKYPISDGWYSSNFGYRIDPFTGQNSMHEGIDFPAEIGTPIVAAASGKVTVAEWHPQYGKMLEIDHGNGLVSRYAHASQLLVKEGDLVDGRPTRRGRRHHRPVDGAASAFRGSAEWHTAKSGPVPAGARLIHRQFTIPNGTNAVSNEG